MKKKYWEILYSFIIIFMICFTPITSFAINDATINQTGNAITVENDGSRVNADNNRQQDVKAVTKLLENYKVSITFIGGLATMTMVLIFMKHFIKLGVLGTEHWALKRNSIMALLWSGLAAALLGAATTIFAISYNLFK